MGFLRRGNKKKDKTLPTSPTVPASLSSPESLHLNLSNNEAITVINNKESNDRGSNIQVDNGYTSRSTINNSLTKNTTYREKKIAFNAQASSSPANLTEDIFLELDASETNTISRSKRHYNNELSTISSFRSLVGPTEAVPARLTTVTSRSSTTTSLREINVAHSNNVAIANSGACKEVERDITPPNATAGDSAGAVTGTIRLGQDSPVNSNRDKKGSSNKSANLSSADSMSNAATVFRTKPVLFKHKTASFLDSDASESEEDDEEDDNATASSSSSSMSFAANVDFNCIKQREEQEFKGVVNKTTDITTSVSNNHLLGGNSGSPSETILMARMKERHRRECRKSWQPMGNKQHHLYLQRVTPTMPTVYTMDNIISPATSRIPMSGSSMSFASTSRLLAASSTVQSRDPHKQKHYRQTVHRPRLSQSLTMPYALDIVSRNTMDISSTPCHPKTSVISSKRDDIMKKLNRSARASSWPSSQSYQQQWKQQKNIFSKGPAPIQVVATSSTLSPPSSPTRTYQQQQKHQQQQQHQKHQSSNVASRLVPMTPPLDATNSPTVSSTKLTQSICTPPDLTLDVKDVPCKVASELECLHDHRSMYSLPDLSHFATIEQQQQSPNDYSQLVEKPLTPLTDSRKETVRAKINNNNNNEAITTTTSSSIEHHKALDTEESAGTTSSFFSSENGMEIGCKHLLPLGDTLPTVLVSQEAGSSQYYLVLSRDQHSVLSAFQHSYNHHRQQQQHTTSCSTRQHHCNDCIMQKKLCCHNHNQYHQYQNNQCHHSPSCKALLTKSTKRQSKCNHSNGKLCNHHQQQQQKQQVRLSHQHHRSTCATHKKNQQHCDKHCGNHYHTRECNGSLYSISSQLKPPSTVSS